MERIGRVALLVMALITLAVVGASEAMHLASDDIIAVVNEARGTTGAQVRTAYGSFFAAQLSRDVDPSDLNAEYSRANELAYRSDRLRELAAVPALIGLLIALLSEKPAQASTEPAAKTSNSGIA